MKFLITAIVLLRTASDKRYFVPNFSKTNYVLFASVSHHNGFLPLDVNSHSELFSRMKLNNKPYTSHPLPYYLVKHMTQYPDSLNFQVS